jgi:hypothetical protein
MKYLPALAALLLAAASSRAAELPSEEGRRRAT